MSKTIVKPANVETADLINYSAVANAARKFAKENGLPVGNRGRLSVELYTQYLMKAPKTARVIAATLGIEVEGKGFVKKDLATELATAIR